jgi:hypothetical protein
MATKTDRPRSWAGYGAFYIGMGMILSASVLNVAHDRLEGLGARSLPGFLADMYELSGKSGVTITFVTIGLSIILLGFALPRRNQKSSSAKRTGAVTPTAVPLFTSTEDGEEGPEVAGGKVVLRTRKFLSPNSGLSGVTGWEPPRQVPST